MAAITQYITGLGYFGRLYGSFAGKVATILLPTRVTLGDAAVTTATLSDALVTTATLTETIAPS